MKTEKKLSLLCLLAIVGILLCGLSNGSPILLTIGGILCLIGGLSFGRLIRITLF